VRLVAVAEKARLRNPNRPVRRREVLILSFYVSVVLSRLLQMRRWGGGFGMIVETKAFCCRACGSERIYKNGHADNGAQRVRCHDCKKTLVMEPKGPPYTEADKERVLAASLERMSMRAIARTFGPCYQTQKSWLAKKKRGPARRRRHAPARAKGRPNRGG
jgi:transposase-like protein